MTDIPHSEEAERAVLGSILLDPERCKDIVIENGVKPDWFFDRSNQLLFEKIMKIEPLDLLTAGEALKGAGLLGYEGAMFSYDYLEDLVDSTPTSAHCEHYIVSKGMLKEKYELRRALEHSDAVRSSVMRGDSADSVKQLAQASAFALSEVTHDTTEVDKVATKAALVEQWKEAENGTVVGIPFPWRELTERTGGLRRGSCCPFIGRDGQGKSTVLGKMVDFWGNQGVAGLVFPFEDGAGRYMARVAGCGRWSNFEADTGRFANTSDEVLAEKWELMHRTLDNVVDMPVYFEDGHMTADEICSRIHKHKRKHDIQWVIVDNFKDIAFDYSNGVTAGETQAAQALQVCAKELQIGIIVSSHLRDVEDDRWLSRRMVKGSKDQFKGARQVLLLQNAGFPEPIMQKYIITENTKMLQMEKNTFGAAGLVGVVLEPDWNLQDLKLAATN